MLIRPKHTGRNVKQLNKIRDSNLSLCRIHSVFQTNAINQILARTCSTSSLLRIFPEADFGTDFIKVTLRNLLKGATCSEINFLTSSSVSELLGDLTTCALGTSPDLASGNGMTTLVGLQALCWCNQIVIQIYLNRRNL